MAQQPPSYEMSTLNVQTTGLGSATAPVTVERSTTPVDVEMGVGKTMPPGPAYENPGYARADQSGIVAARPTQAMYDAQDGGNPAVWHTGQNTTVVVNQPIVRPGPIEQVHSPYPLPTVCFNCNERIVTYIYYQTGCCTYTACILLMMAGCDLGCCLVPFCLDYFKDAVHKCPKCHCILGKYKKL